MAKYKFDKKIFLTGSAGFIGFHVARRLLANGHMVTAIDNLNDYYDVELKKARLSRLSGHDHFRFEKLDLADAAGVNKVFCEFGPDVVVHLAAQAGVRYSLENPAAYGNSNLTGFLNVLEACRNCKPAHLIFASSSSVYGIGSKVPYKVSEKSDHPVSLYAATKKANELMAHSYAHLFSIPMTGLRFFTVYGPWGRPDMAAYIFTSKMFKGESIPVFNNGEMMRDFTYIDDITDGVMRIVEGEVPENGTPDTGGPTEAPFRVYNIGNNEPEQVPVLVSTLEELIGRKAIIEQTEMQPGDVYETYADIEPIRRDYGFAPTTGLREGLKRFIEWHDAYTNSDADK